MARLIDALMVLNMIDRLEAVVSSFLNADWKGASDSGGPPALLSELGRTVSGANRWQIHIPRRDNWSGAEAEKLLRHYGIRIWGRWFTHTTLCFFVKERQANWAEYLLLRRGISIVSPLYNPANAVYAQKYAPGDRPPAWADKDRDALDRLADLL